MAPEEHDSLTPPMRTQLRAAGRASRPRFDDALHRRIMAAVDAEAAGHAGEHATRLPGRGLAAAAALALAAGLIGLVVLGVGRAPGPPAGGEWPALAASDAAAVATDADGTQLARRALQAAIGDDVLVTETIALASAWQAMEEDAAVVLALADQFALGVALAVD